MTSMIDSKENIINTDNYFQKLKNISSSINRVSKKSKSEADVISAFDSYFVPSIRDDLDLDINFSREEYVDISSDSTRVIKKGRIDSRVGSLVIEFKHFSKFKTKKNTDEATKQILQYMDSLHSSGLEKCVGIITDGIKAIKIFKDEEFTNISPVINFDADLLKHISSVLVSSDLKALTSENLVKDFTGDSDNISNVLTLVLLDELNQKASGKTKMLFDEWKELFRLSHNDKSKQKAIEDRKLALEEVAGKKLKANEEEYEVLFCIQTAYAIIIKVIAFHVISKIHSSSSSSITQIAELDKMSLLTHMKSLEDGAIFRDFGIGNLLEGDFFSWYAQKNHWNEELCNHIKQIYLILSSYEGRSVFINEHETADLFQELYQSIIPDKVRHSLGEFYTPSWLADHVITEAERLIETKKLKALDPCCGSGTFITRLIGKVIKQNEGKKDLLEIILNSVKGVDLNPLAVLSARVNYFINISHLLDESSQIEIPIYLGDASYVPEEYSLGGIKCFKYSIQTLKGSLEIVLPKSIVSDNSKFSKAMTDIELHIKNFDENSIFHELSSICSQNDLTGEIIEALKDLARNLVHLEKQEWNGIWARIITNFLTTANLGKFNLIVGNPPWIDWKNLPEGYRDRIKSICIDRSLFSGDSVTGGINLNICALIANVSAENWLDNDGVLSFLMPQNILFQQTYEGFRNFKLKEKRLFLQKVVDWTKSGHPFSPVQYKFVNFIFKETIKDYDKGIPVTKIIKKSGTRKLLEFNKIDDYQKISNIFDEENALVGTVLNNATSFSYAKSSTELNGYKSISGIPEYAGREGIEFFPQELFLLKFKEIVGNKVLFQNYQGGAKSKYRVPPQDILLEEEFIYPLIKGTQIDQFHIKETEFYVPFPYENDSRSPIELSVLTKKSKLLAKFFQRNRAVIDNQTAYDKRIIGEKNFTEFYALARVGKYTYSDYAVCYRDNTRWCAAVSSPIKTPWGSTKQPLFQNHAASITQRSDGNFISEDEAHYICAIFNSSYAKKFIESSSDSRTYKIKPPLKIPTYDETKKEHSALSNLSIKAHNNVKNGKSFDEEIKLIDDIVLRGTF